MSRPTDQWPSTKQRPRRGGVMGDDGLICLPQLLERLQSLSDLLRPAQRICQPLHFEQVLSIGLVGPPRLPHVASDVCRKVV
jgi:hypothetical protein